MLCLGVLCANVSKAELVINYSLKFYRIKPLSIVGISWVFFWCNNRYTATIYRASDLRKVLSFPPKSFNSFVRLVNNNK